MSIVIQTIEQSSPYLADIKRLGKRNSATLGFFPEGAFDDHAQRQQIFAAISEDGKLAGYLLYRVSNRTARIVHLCVDEPFLGKGVSKLLVDQLKLDTEDLVGISLKCRRDYDANTLWPHLGFSAQAEMPGRGRSPRNLVYWWYGHGHPTLFDFARTDDGETRVTAAVDANIFYDLFEDNRDGHVESIALRADWLGDSVQLVLSDEINNEINRSNDPLTRKISRERINEFERFHYSNVEAEKIARALELLHPNNVTKLTVTDRSDIRQLAAAAAGGLQFFLTRDGILLGADFRAAVLGAGDLLEWPAFFNESDPFLCFDAHQHFRNIGYRAIIRAGLRNIYLIDRRTPKVVAKFLVHIGCRRLIFRSSFA
ncbi:MAG: GNAT family N-acetyltransferase [Pyrinomonadaceae bacterium]